MAENTLTKLSAGLKVNIGAVLRTRMNTDDQPFVKLPARRMKRLLQVASAG